LSDERYVRKERMSAKSSVGSAPQARKRTWYLAPWLLPLLGLPVIAAGVAAATVSYREARAYWALHYADNAPFSKTASSGDRWLEDTFRELTSPEGTAVWSQVFFLLSTADTMPTETLPWVDNGPLPPLGNSSQSWEAEEHATEYLQHKRPIIELIYQACQAPAPVWQPIAFHGVATLLPELDGVRSAARLLQLEAEHALFHGDSQRAMAAIEGLRKTAEAIDWQIFVVADITHFSIKYLYLTSIQRSLQTPVWSVEQLQQLSQQLAQPVPVTEHWQRGIRGEQAMVESVLNTQQEYFAGMRMFAYPSAMLQVPEHYGRLRELVEPANGLLSDRALGFEKSFVNSETMRGGGRVLFGYLMLAAQAYAKSIENAEQLRKLTRVAVELKRFYLQHQRWPETLADLSDQGLAADDWTIAGAGPMGYSLEDNSAHVWGLGHDQRRISPTRPVSADESHPELPHLVTVPAL